MNKIIITSPSYNSSIGGSIVLHKLCHILNNIGYDAYLYPTLKQNGTLDSFYLNDSFTTKIATEFNPNKDILLYPEIEPGNPLGGKNIIRYILNKFHLPEYDNNVQTWGNDDYWLYFHELFYDGIKPPNFLHIIDTKLDIYKDYNLERKIESCFTYRKKNNERYILKQFHPEESIEIGYNVQDEELVNIFNICKRFYSYDTETYLSVLAAQCGCESVIIPYKGVSKETIINSQPSFKYGIAYGLEDLEYAVKTQPQLIKYLRELDNKQINDTKIAFEKIFKYFNL